MIGGESLSASDQAQVGASLEDTVDAQLILAVPPGALVEQGSLVPRHLVARGNRARRFQVYAAGGTL